MATWVMHLRVAEKLRQCETVADIFADLDEQAYYIGAIAPDSGRMVGNFTYIPPKDVSHWKREDVSYQQRFFDNREFYLKYYVNESDSFRKSLFWGYYIHILTDTIYVRDIIHPFMKKRGMDFWRANIENIRKGWYEIDFRFVERNPDYLPLKILADAKPFENGFIDYFEETDIYNRVQNAVSLYENSVSDKGCVFYTHTEEEAEILIDRMVEEISKFIIENK